MSNQEFFDRLFDILNDSDLDIADLQSNSKTNTLTVILQDGGVFRISLLNSIMMKKCNA